MASQRPHKVQIAAFEAGHDKPGFAYYMEQGLGKTRTALMDFAEKVADGTATRLVVVCPNSFKGGWKDEIEKWGYEFDVHLWEAGSSSNKYWLNRVGDKPPVLVINYESIRMKKTGSGRATKWVLTDALYFIGDFVRDRDAMLVFDESIQIKTHDSAQTKGALEMARWFAFRRVLSGKPISQGPHDLWAQMRAIGHLDGRAYYPFKGAFCVMGGWMGKQILGAQNEDILAELIDPVVFRATKVDWTDLPPKTYTIREYKLSPEMKAKYREMEEDFITWLDSGDMVTVEAAITKYIKLAQIQAGFILDEDGKTHWLVDDARNPRLNGLLEFIDEELTGKLIIVYNHKAIKDQLVRALSPIGGVAWIHGGMTADEISEQKRRFNEDADCRFMVITKAAKYGHTLLGDQTNIDLACATMAFYENTYSLDDRSQLEDRAHRHGQLQEAMGYIDFAGTPLDKNCVRALQRKEGIFQSVFSSLARASH